MLLLAPPSRRRNDVAISIRAPAGDRGVAIHVTDEAMGFSCPPETARKVHAAIYHSGRYDCRVAPDVIWKIAEFRDLLAEAGGDVFVTEPMREPSLAKYLDRLAARSGGWPFLPGSMDDISPESGSDQRRGERWPMR